MPRWPTNIVAFNDQNKPPLRVIGFSSEKEYANTVSVPWPSPTTLLTAIAITSSWEAYESQQFGVAAHEYFHYVLHAGGVKLPACLQEGLAEVISTLRVTPGGYTLGGDLPIRTQALQAVGKRLLPLDDLLGVSEKSVTANGRREAERFYAESWAFADMLVASPKYASRFDKLVAEFNTGSNGPAAFQKVYAKSLDQVAEDLVRWINQSHTPQLRPLQPPPLSPPPVFDLSAAHTQYLLAELSLVSGNVAQATSRYQDLALRQPTNPDVFVALGLIALRQGNRAEALKDWRLAVKLNVQDPELCYRYAVLAEEAGVNEGEIKIGLERALVLSPSYEDARYRLALIEYHASNYQSALDHLRKMSVPADTHRRYAYLIAVASSLLELNQNEEARKVANEAVKAAQNEHDRSTAMELSYVASTDLHVQLSTDADGNSQMVTTRAAHGTKNWNPFIEPSDRIQHSNGQLSQVLCTKGKLTGFVLRTSQGLVTLDVADPSRILMRNSPNEFYCGPIHTAPVDADYAIVQSTGMTKYILRGMNFQPDQGFVEKAK